MIDVTTAEGRAELRENPPDRMTQRDWLWAAFDALDAAQARIAELERQLAPHREFPVRLTTARYEQLVAADEELRRRQRASAPPAPAHT